MKSRALILINATGCLLLAALVVAQWQRERALVRECSGLRGDLQASLQAFDAEQARARGLEADIAMLKESLEQAAAAAREAEAALERQAGALDALRRTVEDANRQIRDWQQAVAERDRQIGDLGEALKATRERLDEAVRRLRGETAR